VNAEKQVKFDGTMKLDEKNMVREIDMDMPSLKTSATVGLTKKGAIKSVKVRPYRKRGLLSVAILMVLLLGSMSMPHAAALTSSWQIVTKDTGGNATNAFQATSIMNVTILPPGSLTIGGVRSLVVWSTTQKAEFTRYTLGYYPSGSNQSQVPKNLVINLGAFSSLINGDTLLLQIRSSTDSIEFTTAVTVQVDFKALLKQQQDYFYGLFNDLQNQIYKQGYEMSSEIDTLMRYIAVMGIVIAFLVAYSTRDLWYSKRKRTEQEKSDSEFEQFLEAFIVERHSAGDVDTGEKVHG